MFTFDPGFMATAACESQHHLHRRRRGVLLYRGYPIEQIAAKSNFLEAAYLLIQGELPSAASSSSSTARSATTR